MFTMGASPSGTGISAVFTTSSRTWAQLISGFAARTLAHTPLTWAAAGELPLTRP